MIDMREYNDILPCKVALLGDSGVGKSSIISRFVHSKFIEDCLPTLGNCYTSKIVKYEQFKKNIKYELWDTAGQEKYRSVSRIFYQDAVVIFLIFDITNRRTFESIEQYWYNELKEHLSESLALVLVGNKYDLYEYEKVTPDEAKSLAERIGAFYQSVSANKNEGIDRLFNEIGIKLLKRTSSNEPSPLERSIANSKKSSVNVTLDKSVHSRANKGYSCCSIRAQYDI